MNPDEPGCEIKPCLEVFIQSSFYIRKPDSTGAAIVLIEKQNID
ncbi:MAG: hypothetical protein WKF59_19885 [Chitinophagaceae bacterium]